MVYNWLYIHLLFAHHVAILPRPWKWWLGDDFPFGNAYFKAYVNVSFREFNLHHYNKIAKPANLRHQSFP